jgi:hypothetical protein
MKENEPPDAPDDAGDSGDAVGPDDAAGPGEQQDAPTPDGSSPGEITPDSPRKKRVRQVDPAHLGTFRWLQGTLGQALAVILAGEPVGQDRMDVGPAGDFLSRIDRLTRLLAAHFAGEEPKATGTIARPAGVGRLQLAEARAGSSITLYFALDRPTQLTLEGGSDLYASPMGRAVLELVRLVGSSDDEQALILRSHELGDRIADRYYELMDFLVNEQVEAHWIPRDRSALVLSTEGAAEVKALLDREVAEHVETREFEGRLYEANARTNGFQLETAGERIDGQYPEELTDFIRWAWDRDVRARIRVIQRRRARSAKPFKVEYILLDVVPLAEDNASSDHAPE